MGAVLCLFASIADKGKTVSFDKIGCTSAIEASFIALGLHYFCHFLFRSSAHERKWRNEFSSLRRYGFYVVATIRCSISLALLFTKLMMSAWCSVSLFCSPWHCTTFICSSENSTVSTLCSAILAEKMMQSGLSE